MDKLIAAGLLTFTVPPNTTFVVGEDGGTGFLNSYKELEGWGLQVYGTGTTEEAVWDGEGNVADGVHRYVDSGSNSVYKRENGRDVLGRRNHSDGTISYIVDAKSSYTFNQEAEDFANKVNACISDE